MLPPDPADANSLVGRNHARRWDSLSLSRLGLNNDHFKEGSYDLLRDLLLLIFCLTHAEIGAPTGPAELPVSMSS